ncbi:MAG TPA: hypothetical protein VHA05_03120 [Candidatus Saccharimonadales bacterium]|nr:hypothetical protein [Candidatus Saccharimonadales bacterium]
MTSPDNSGQPHTFGHDEAIAVVAACRESIVDIVRGCMGGDGEFHPSPEDDPAVLPLARIAFHAAESAEAELPTSELDMHFLKFALKRFSDQVRVKRAVHESSLQFGTLNNPEIEQRIAFGAVAGRLLENLDPEFAAASMEEARRRFPLITASIDPASGPEA